MAADLEDDVANDMVADVEDDMDLMSLLMSYHNWHWDVYRNWLWDEA